LPSPRADRPRLNGMPANERPDPIFITDAPGIDFLNSIATPVETPIEWLDTGADLLDWLDRAGLVPADVCATFRATALPGELDAVAAAARSLRDWFRVFVRAHQGRPLTNDAIAEVEFLNQVLARDEGFAQIEIDAAIDESDRAELHLHERRRWRSPAALLAPLARAAGGGAHRGPPRGPPARARSPTSSATKASQISRPARARHARFTSSTETGRAIADGAAWPFAATAPSKTHAVSA
jgi:hypothetical protein